MRLSRVLGKVGIIPHRYLAPEPFRQMVKGGMNEFDLSQELQRGSWLSGAELVWTEIG